MPLIRAPWASILTTGHAPGIVYPPDPDEPRLLDEDGEPLLDEDDGELLEE